MAFTQSSVLSTQSCFSGLLGLFLLALTPLTLAQTNPGGDEQLQIQKPSVQPAQTQQLPALPSERQPKDGAKAADPKEGEQFFFPLPRGWKQATAEQVFNIRTTQFFPEGQSAANWEEMLRSRIFFYVREAPMDNFVLEAASGPQDQCEDAMLTPVMKGTVNGYASLSMIRFCTRDRTTGQGEVAMIKVIQGRDSLYIGERAWRVRAFAREEQPVPKEKLDRWIELMGSFLVCDARDPKRPCPK